jgi:acyl-CoA reductase-like NAD-dependent aldehyde dehydrogenase
MDTIDADLAALQEARTLARQAREAAGIFCTVDAEAAWVIANKVAQACAERAEHYAEWAVRESGIGNKKDKIIKNRRACTDLLDYYKSTSLGGFVVDHERNMISIGRPAGVVMGLVPSTSPIATLFFKSLACLMTRNALILSPHPKARECSISAARFVARVAEMAGAPRNAIQIHTRPTMEATRALMSSRDIDVILATGGGPMVRAAYSSGTPAIGVGPGNVPVYVDATADVARAASDLVASKDFDHGSPCSSPTAVIAEKSIADALISRMKAEGSHFCSEDELRALEAFAFPHDHLNAEIVGKPAEWIAEHAGIAVPKGTRILVGTFVSAATDSPMQREKLSPILGFVISNGFKDAVEVARGILARSGAGHTAGISTSDPDAAFNWGVALDVNRVVVNQPTAMGAIGAGNGLAPTFTIGTGFAGRSSLGENAGPHHLINWKRVAYPSGSPLPEFAKQHARTTPAAQDRWSESSQVRPDIKQLVDLIVCETFAELGNTERA